MKELLSAVPKKVLFFLHSQGKYVGLSVIVRERVRKMTLSFLYGITALMWEDLVKCYSHVLCQAQYQTLQSFP